MENWDIKRNDFMINIDKDGNVIIPDNLIKKYKNNIFKQANLPVKYWDYEIDNFSLTQDAVGKDLTGEAINQKSKAKDLALKYIENVKDLMAGKNIEVKTKICDMETKNLFFYGGPASGKTMLLVIILKEALKYSKKVLYLDWSTLVSTLSRFDKIDEINDITYIFKNYDLIAVDNISKLSLSSFGTMNLDVIFTQRNAINKPLLFGSYIVPDEFSKIVGLDVQRYLMETLIVKLPSSDINRFIEF
jgi:DNA replication protein DnaC